MATRVEKKVSTFGRYEGYTEEAAYDGSIRRSEYLSLSDGTKLAYDLILPTSHGQAPAAPLPTLFRYTPYGRAWTIFDRQGHNLITKLAHLGMPERSFLRLRYLMDRRHGSLFDPLMRTRWMAEMVQHGYAVFVVDRPGTGASFGNFTNDMQAVGREEAEILNWVARQPWADGNIGMNGESNNAMVQFPAAALGNPHLKAILPASAGFDLYDSIIFAGGIYNSGFANFVRHTVPYLDTLATPVDADPEGEMLAAARAERGEATYTRLVESMRQYPFRDSQTASGSKFWERAGLFPFVDAINAAGTPAYLTVGWYDIFAADSFLWFENLTVPKRLTVRPLDHSGADENGSDLDYAAEARRWFDYWLKGIDNGIMEEPPIHYYVDASPGDRAWHEASALPLPCKPIGFYFGTGRSGSIASVNDGTLIANHAPDAAGVDSCAVDYSTTTGAESRWTAVNQERRYPDLSVNDCKALTYTTAPLEREVTVIGSAVAHISLRATTSDADIFVYLEDVKPDGKSGYVTEGQLRASHRRLGSPAYRTLGFPFPSHLSGDVQPLKVGEAVEAVFALLPAGYRFGAGHRIRVTIAFADSDNFDTPVLDPPPRIEVLRTAANPPRVELPVMQEAPGDAAAPHDNS